MGARFAKGLAAIAGAGLLGAAAPASAERIRTFWRLEPVAAQAPRNVAFGAPFFEQRLLPVRLVELTGPLAAGGRALPQGTLLYLVFNDAGKIGYCTIKDRSDGNKAKTLFIPILDQRPCLVDSDGDGRFDRSFSVYDKYGGPPSARGSIDAASPLPSSGGYRRVDVHAFPDDLRVSLRFSGKRDAAKARLGVKFSRNLGEWPPRRGVPTGRGALFELLNAHVLLTAVAGDVASLAMTWDEGVYLSTDNANTLYWGPLPPFVARD
ncbi:MAG TPA: hypothetical protein VFZ91_08620 [Allosphingosinicella sp.]